MKKLIITFTLSIGIICAIVFYNIYKGDDATSEVTFIKTLVQNDSVGRPSVTLTLELVDNKWIESELSEKFYDESSTTTIISAFVNGNWEKREKIIEDYYNGQVQGKTIYKPLNDEWKFESKVNLTDDLSKDNGIFHDIVFDMYGNLIMDATYMWNDKNNIGLNKEEYIYDENEKMIQKISYVWQNNQWQKNLVADLLYQQNRK